MRLHLLAVPYDSSRRDWRMGRGPLRLLDGAVARLGDAAGRTILEAGEPFLEIGTAFQLAARVAAATRAARAAGELPVVLSGNCFATLGLLAGLTPRRRGLIWLDAHGDFNTPETSPSGYLDGMALAVVAGRCWRTLAGALPGHEPVAEEDIILVGARDLDAPERAAIEASRMRHLGVADVRAGRLDEALDALAGRVEAAVLHVDLDVHDPERTPANCYPAPGGLFPAEVQEVARRVAARLPLAGATLASFDPEVDTTGETAAAGLAVIDLLAG